MASVYEDWSDDRGGVDVSIVEWWWPDFLIFTRKSTRAAHSSKLTIHTVSSTAKSYHCQKRRERERERDLFTIYVCTSRIKFDGRPRKKVFPNPQRDLSRHESLADDRTSQVWHCPLFSAFVDERSLEPPKFR